MLALGRPPHFLHGAHDTARHAGLVFVGTLGGMLLARDAHTLQPVDLFGSSGSSSGAAEGEEADGSCLALFRAGGGQVSSIAIKGELLIASGYTRFEQPVRGAAAGGGGGQTQTVFVPDPFVKVVDLRTGKQLAAVAYSSRLVRTCRARVRMHACMTRLAAGAVCRPAWQRHISPLHSCMRMHSAPRDLDRLTPTISSCVVG